MSIKLSTKNNIESSALTQKDQLDKGNDLAPKTSLLIVVVVVVMAVKLIGFKLGPVHTSKYQTIKQIQVRPAHHCDFKIETWRV